MSDSVVETPAAVSTLMVGLAPPTSAGMADMAMTRSVALVLENAAVTQRDVQRLEEASLTVTLALMVKTAAAQCGGS
jgi:hypothetical protein